MTTSTLVQQDLKPLQQRIWAHPFEWPEHSQDLTRRLALEQGWSLPQARAAVEEYRRFCFLACACIHPVTPSVEVDAVWHLHLLHTRDYWEEFCPRVLERSLHHGPTRGGQSEEMRFYDQYAQTLASYQLHFGPPPLAWWPPARQRFLPARLWRWVYLPDTWVFPHPRRWRSLLKARWFTPSSPPSDLVEQENV